MSLPLAPLSTPVPIFINRIQHSGLLRIWFAASAMRFRSWFSVFISTSYTKSFVSCGPKNKNPKGLNRGIRDANLLDQSEPVSHKHNGTEGLLQENARCIVALPLLI
jgi:hypothetical protein